MAVELLVVTANGKLILSGDKSNRLAASFIRLDSVIGTGDTDLRWLRAAGALALLFLLLVRRVPAFVLTGDGSGDRIIDDMELDKISLVDFAMPATAFSAAFARAAVAVSARLN